MAASASTSANLNNNCCHIFINYHALDVKKTFGSHLHRRLVSHGLIAFMDEEQPQQGDNLTSQIEGTIKSASVHLAIFSPRYVESKRCLEELLVMLKWGVNVIPVFYHVKPSDLRRTRLGDGDGVYAEAFGKHEEKQIYDPQTIQNWRYALLQAAGKKGFELEDCNGDEGELLDKVVKRVLESGSKRLFINHRGPDVKKTFGSHLYRRFLSHGLRAFLDQQELQGGDNFTSQIEAAIRSASVHIAVFSPRYAESSWCLNELLLMLETGAPIIPVFYHVRPSDLRWTRVKNKFWGTREKTGLYAQALQKLENRYDSTTMEKWRNALSRVADISGLDLEAFHGDEGELLDKVVERVLKL